MTQQSRPRYMITHSLLNSFEYMYNAEEKEQDKTMRDFMNVLNRVKTEPTKAMLAGREFENLVSDMVKNPLCVQDADKKLRNGAYGIVQIINPDNLHSEAYSQVKCKQFCTVNNVDYMLYGVLDWLCGDAVKGKQIIYDIKFKQNISNYHVGDYYGSTQHRMYFELAPDADAFVYLISDGRRVMCEEYQRRDCEPIKETIERFEEWLKMFGLWDVYCDKWKCKY